MIEQATKDDAGELLPLLLDAIGGIAYSPAGTESLQEAALILERFCKQENNRISYQRVLVYRKEGAIAGMLLSYPGDGAAELDRPLLERPGRSDYAVTAGITLEARAGEYYLDSLAVSPAFQGQGIAKELIRAFEQRGMEAGYRRLSLIVELGNSLAHRLYERLGYAEDGGLEIAGCTYLRMIKQVLS